MQILSISWRVSRFQAGGEARGGMQMEKNEMPEQAANWSDTKRLLLPIPPLAGRPIRREIISSDDIVNLQIALNTAVSLDDFLEEV
jgi:hypothetical protein